MTSHEARLIATDPLVLEVWRRLTRRFAIWRLIILATFTRRALIPASNNNIGQMLATEHWKTGLGLLGGLDDDQLDFIAELANINARRVEYVFRTSSLLLVTLPVGVFIGFSELAPELLHSLGIGTVPATMTVLAIWLVFAGLMMAAGWRARDMLDVINFEQSRRTLDRARQG